MTDCIFCKIVKGDIPNYTVYEDKEFLAFLDIYSSNLGHTLVIPKKHTRWVWDYFNPGDYFEVCTIIAKKLRKTFNTELVTSNIVGDEINHAHIHLIPSTNNKTPKHAYNKDQTPEQLKKIANKIFNTKL